MHRRDAWQHDWHYVHRLKSVCELLSEYVNDGNGLTSLDGDTQVSHGTYAAAMVAAGAATQAVDRVMRGEVRNAFCATRPPGHHAGPSGAVSDSGTDPAAMHKGSQSHGFCLLNNVAIAAAYAMSVVSPSNRIEWNRIESKRACVCVCVVVCVCLKGGGEE